MKILRPSDGLKNDIFIFVIPILLRHGTALANAVPREPSQRSPVKRKIFSPYASRRNSRVAATPL
ncbi:MAG: hypothetical protein WC641_01945 [Patescibacteria group bacterium]